MKMILNDIYWKLKHIERNLTITILLYLNTCINPIQTFEGSIVLTHIDNASYGLGDCIRSWTSRFPLSFFFFGLACGLWILFCLFFFRLFYLSLISFGVLMATPSELVFSAISVHTFFLFICNYIWVLWIYGGIIFFHFPLY